MFIVFLPLLKKYFSLPVPPQSKRVEPSVNVTGETVVFPVASHLEALRGDAEEQADGGVDGEQSVGVRVLQAVAAVLPRVENHGRFSVARSKV